MDSNGNPVVIHNPTKNRIEQTYQPSNPAVQDVQLTVVHNATTDVVTPTEPSTPKYVYPRAEDLVHKMVRDESWSTAYWIWVRYVRWWIRWLLVILTMYWLMVLDNLVTLRHHQTARFYIGGLPPKPFSLNSLPDLLLDLGYITNPSATTFVSATPPIAIVGMVLIILTRRKYAVLAEIVWIESINLFLIALVQIMTAYPDSYTENAICWIPRFNTYGSWVWLHVATAFCGDLMWSGHTYHTFFSFIMIYRHFYPRLLTGINVWLYTLCFWTFFGLWFIAFVFCLLGIHLHYSSDVIVAIVVTLFLTTNRAILGVGVAFFYPVLNAEQIFIHLLPEYYKSQQAPEEEHAVGHGEFI